MRWRCRHIREDRESEWRRVKAGEEDVLEDEGS